jgi:transcriptional regulator with XRE-family HTH domain
MNKLKEIRERMLVTQQELAERTGLTEATLSRIENGHRRPHFMTRKRIARVLKCTVEELNFNGSE